MNDIICGHVLDEQQKAVILSENKHILVVAGAGSGKTLTIIGKIFYLVKYKLVDPKEILCISFTRDSTNNLREKLKKELSCDIDVYTFHKLGLTILDQHKEKFDIADPELLKNIIEDFFNADILHSEKHMRIVLNYFGIYFINNVKTRYLKFLKNSQKEIKLFYSLIETFIKLFKCNNYKLEDFNNFEKKIRYPINFCKYNKEKNLLVLILNIYLRYETYLEQYNEIDFDDMIIHATKLVNTNGIDKKYKFVIIDEYQDTSLIRFQLIKAVLDQTGAKLMAVGDDFQSIYRFTGCDISLFLNFHRYFSESKIFKIETTYRNSQELINVAGNFVMKNKNQISKNLVSSKHINYPIKLVYYKNRVESFLNLILNIYTNTKKSILVLGRNNKDIEMFVDNNFEIKGEKVIYLKNNDIDISYLTVHRAKGLEAESVIILNLENSILGFPNKLKSDRIFRLVSSKNDKYLYAEERRLFYVALSRTKEYVYLLTQKNNSSIFVEELLQDYKQYIEIINC